LSRTSSLRESSVAASLTVELGVDPTGLYRVVRLLDASGDVRKNGR
jgi:hypothetical protein